MMFFSHYCNMGSLNLIRPAVRLRFVLRRILKTKPLTSQEVTATFLF